MVGVGLSQSTKDSQRFQKQGLCQELVSLEEENVKRIITTISTKELLWGQVGGMKILKVLKQGVH